MTRHRLIVTGYRSRFFAGAAAAVREPEKAGLRLTDGGYRLSEKRKNPGCAQAPPQLQPNLMPLLALWLLAFGFWGGEGKRACVSA